MHQAETVGQALRLAKAHYFNELDVRAMTPYDEKILSVPTLYGLPMLQINMLGTDMTVATVSISPEYWEIGETTTCPNEPSLTRRNVSFTPQNEYDPPHREPVGTYYTAGDEAPHTVWQQPIQPRSNITMTLPLIARGALFLSGTYATESRQTEGAPFDPAITRVITQTRQTDEQGLTPEPVYNLHEWRPTNWDLINTIRTPEGRQQRLVVVPAQYRYWNTVILGGSIPEAEVEEMIDASYDLVVQGLKKADRDRLKS